LGSSPNRSTGLPGRVNVRRDGGIANVEIDNPPVNALDAAVLVELGEAFAQLDSDASVAAVILRGAGTRAFVAGADITEFVGLDAAAAIALAGRVQQVANAIATCRQPVVAAIHGFCLGGGLELALACDIRIAAEDSQVGLPEIKLGLLPGGGGTQRLHRVVGPGRARLLTLTGDPISAQTALEWNLVERVVPVAGLDEAVLELARTFVQRSATSLAAIKALLNETADGSIEEGLGREAETFGACIESDDGREGVCAFLEKRVAVWPTRAARAD
jgi:enoyl-CoA hydratase